LRGDCSVSDFQHTIFYRVFELMVNHRESEKLQYS
jgi:hypothetical protein